VTFFIAALIVASAIGAAVVAIAGEMKRAREEALRERQLSIAALFAPALSQLQDDPRIVLTWQPLARTLRRQLPQEFAALDAAAGSTFPFSNDAVMAAHSRWTADWLAWERTHDATYKLKALEAQQTLRESGESAVARAKLDAIEREKLDLYQRRYEEYVRVAKALQTLAT
jgi:hypothetical protein